MCTHLMFQNMRLGGSNLVSHVEQQETLKEMTSDPSILGLYSSSQGPWEVVEGMYVCIFVTLYVFLVKTSVQQSTSSNFQPRGGTPAVNRASELYTQLEAVSIRLGRRWFWKHRSLCFVKEKR